MANSRETGLVLQMGLNRDARRHRMINSMAADCQDDLVRKVYMLVPEPSTYVMSREAVKKLGAEACNKKVDVIGFQQLGNRVRAALGGTERYLDDGGRLMAMAIAVDEAKKDLTILRETAYRPEVMGQLLDSYTTMRQNGITTDALMQSKDDISSKDGILARKLIDMATIYSAYERICKEGAMDPTEQMVALCQKLYSPEGRAWLAQSKWYVEGFIGFDQQQTAILQAIMSGAICTTVNLAAAGLDDECQGSLLAAQTGRILADMGKGVGLEVSVVRTGDESLDPLPLAYVQEHLTDSTPAEPFRGVMTNNSRVRLYCDHTVYDECVHVVGTILSAVRSKAQSRYRDISIILCDYDRYAPVLEAVCERYGIPAYFSGEKDEVSKSPVMLPVYKALDAATRGMQMEDVLQYIKSDLCNISRYESDILENYIRSWRIYGRAFDPGEDGWDSHPEGFGVEFTPETEALLGEINAAREKAIEPLLALRDALTEGQTIGDYVMALYSFLDAIGYHARLQTIVDELQQLGERQKAMEYGQVSKVLNGAMEQMYGIIGHLKKSTGDFAKMFRLLCSVYKIATIPVSVDQVEVFRLEDARYTCSPIRYILGAEEGVFPRYNPPVGLLDAAEIKILQEAGIDMPGTVRDMSLRSLAEIATVVSGAKQMLILSYASEPSAPTTPSHLYTRMQELFPGVTPVNGAGPGGIYDADLQTAKQAGRLMGKIHMADAYSNVIQSLMVVRGSEELGKVANSVVEKAAWTLNDLSEQTVRDFYGNTIPLSATRVDTYSSCRYFYFFRYILSLKEGASGGLDSPTFGRFAHAVLEKAVREIEQHGGFATVTMEQMESITRRYIEEYRQAELARNMKGRPDRYHHLFLRQCREVESIMGNLCREMQVSKFHAQEFELHVGGKDADVSAIRIEGETMTGSFTGVIDRVDTATVNGTEYFRVLDYKTGRSKTFDKGDILLGQSLQLLLYQGALREHHYGNLTATDAAGCLYVPTKAVIVATATKVDEDKVLAERRKMLERKGVLLNELDVLAAMEAVAGDAKHAEFLPLAYKADGSVNGDIYSAEQLALMDKFAKIKMAMMVNDLSRGRIKPNPITKGLDRSTCSYCPFRGACHRDLAGSTARYRKACKTDEEFFAEIERTIQEYGEDPA